MLITKNHFSVYSRHCQQYLDLIGAGLVLLFQCQFLDDLCFASGYRQWEQLDYTLLKGYQRDSW